MNHDVSCSNSNALSITVIKTPLPGKFPVNGKRVDTIEPFYGRFFINNVIMADMIVKK